MRLTTCRSVPVAVRIREASRKGHFEEAESHFVLRGQYRALCVMERFHQASALLLS